MKALYINNLKLPPILVEMIEAGRWKLPGDVERLAELTGVNRPMDFSFLSLEGMEGETEGARKLALDERYSSIYNLYSSKREPNLEEREDSLDVDKAVMIAVNWDEEAIFLDYRQDIKNPSVVLAYWPQIDGPTSHRILSLDFATFLAEIGL